LDLRDYQHEALIALRRALAGGKRRPVVQMPTGAGKTILAAKIVQGALDKGNRVMFTVPAISLIDQTVERFRQSGIDRIGVIQASHDLTDWRQPVQVASVQTLMRRSVPDVSLAIVDEAHLMFKFYETWFASAKIPIIGLTATPWRKGMGQLWDDLIVGTTTQGLIDQGVLADFKVFAPAHPDLSGVKTIAGDYETSGLSRAMDQQDLVADIVKTWLDLGQNRPTLVFAVDRLHAKHLQTKFGEAGIDTDYIDAFTPPQERAEVALRFSLGYTKVVCNVGVLTTGIDWDVRCIILARPTKSEILYTQIIGRGLRKAEGKDYCLILDHSDTTLRLGFVTDIHHDALDDGSVKKVEKKDKQPLPKECPKCAFLRPPKISLCPACGFQAVAVNRIESGPGELYELIRGEKIKAVKMTMVDKQKFYSELLRYAEDRGYKQGWAYHAYRHKMHVGPDNKLSKSPSSSISPSTMAFVRHLNIFRAKSKS
jgi:superfamily II DNA or RNA helicase